MISIQWRGLFFKIALTKTQIQFKFYQTLIFKKENRKFQDFQFHILHLIHKDNKFILNAYTVSHLKVKIMSEKK